FELEYSDTVPQLLQRLREQLGDDIASIDFLPTLRQLHSTAYLKHFEFQNRAAAKSASSAPGIE
ncbi:MAG: hypothetical protein KDD44_13855, partial [Bdellovibrionales bacterium]|nr:hypothetical protein [Bdellovibrionales bacterium]